MNILFLGTTGVHHTIIAAHEYLGTLTNYDYRSLKYFNDKDRELSGYPIFIAFDDKGNKVYTLGGGSDISMVTKTIEQLVKILGFSEQDLVVRPIIIKNEKLLMFLHRISHTLPIDYLIMPLFNYLLRKEMPFIRKQVKEIQLH